MSKTSCVGSSQIMAPSRDNQKNNAVLNAALTLGHIARNLIGMPEDVIMNACHRQHKDGSISSSMIFTINEIYSLSGNNEQYVKEIVTRYCNNMARYMTEGTRIPAENLFGNVINYVLGGNDFIVRMDEDIAKAINTPVKTDLETAFGNGRYLWQTTAVSLRYRNLVESQIAQGLISSSVLGESDSNPLQRLKADAVSFSLLVSEALRYGQSTIRLSIDQRCLEGLIAKKRRFYDGNVIMIDQNPDPEDGSTVFTDRYMSVTRALNDVVTVYVNPMPDEVAPFLGEHVKNTLRDLTNSSTIPPLKRALLISEGPSPLVDAIVNRIDIGTVADKTTGEGMRTESYEMDRMTLLILRDMFSGRDGPMNGVANAVVDRLLNQIPGNEMPE